MATGAWYLLAAFWLIHIHHFASCWIPPSSDASAAANIRRIPPLAANQQKVSWKKKPIRTTSSLLLLCAKANPDSSSSTTSTSQKNEVLKSLLLKYGFNRRLIVLRATDLPVLAEVYLNGKSELCCITALRPTKDPTIEVQLLSPDESTTTTSSVVVVVDLGQITTVWDQSGLHLMNLQQEIQRQWNQIPLGYMETCLDGLYKSHVGRARGSHGHGRSNNDHYDQKNNPPLTKKQIGKLVTSTTVANDRERIHADNVLRQLIKTGTGCSRLVDSKSLARLLYSNSDDDDENNNDNSPSHLLLLQRAVAAQVLARDAESGGRFKRMPCTFVDDNKIGKMTAEKRGEDDDEKEEETTRVQSFSIVNGGWLVVDQNVRAGSEARKFAQRIVQRQQQQSSSNNNSEWTLSDERIAQRLECLAMGEVFSKQQRQQSNDDDESDLEVDVRETLKALGAPCTTEGARSVLFQIGRWSRGDETKNTGKRLGEGPQPWSPRVLEASKWYREKQSSTRTKASAIVQEGYANLTNIPFVCIDAKRTSFRDDAVGVRPRASTGRKVVKGASKWEILVSIADVSDLYATTSSDEHHKTSSNHMSTLREAAASRGVSRYDLPLGPLHLLPPVVLEALSFNTIAATKTLSERKSKKKLAHDFNRCVTIWVYVDERSGKLLDAGIERSVVSPPVALSYQQATDLLDGNLDTSNNPILRRTGQVLGVVERSIMSWSYRRRQNSEAAQKREERLAVKEYVATQQLQHHDTRRRRQSRRDDGHDGFQRTRGHRLVDASLDLYSYTITGLIRRSKAFFPQQAGSGQARGGRVATAPLRRYVDGMAQRQALSVLLGYGGPPMTKAECIRVSREATDAYNTISNVRSVKKGTGATSSSRCPSQKSAIRSLQMYLSGDNRKIVPAVGTGRGNEVVISGVGALAKCKGIRGTLKPGKKVLVKVNKIDVDSGNVAVSRASS